MPEQKRLFTHFTQDFNASTGRDLDDEEFFDSRTISQRTTFDAVTHALHNSKLTDEGGQSLGTALGLITKIDRVAGQYYGGSGDQQFRVYSQMRSETRDILEKSKEFYRDHDNTVYHAGYPLNYRQKGKPPTIQISLVEEGTRADIDVDYRSSKIPQALFNGHLTSSNSDVRAGDNAGRHSKRWSGFIAWWQDIFGEKKFAHNKGSADLLQHDPPELETAVGVNRVPGAHIADLHEAAREFLTDWLVRREYDQAMTFLSDHALACINVDEDNEDEVLNTQRTREELRELMEVAIEANALDVIEDENVIQVQTTPETFESVKSALEGADFVAENSEISMAPQTTVKLTGKDAQTMLKLFEALDDHEDVKQVFTNFDIPEEELMEAAGAG